MSLDASFTSRVGGFSLGIDLHVAAGRSLAVLGANGSGKSTLLRSLAGIRPVESGSITLDGTVLDDGGTVCVPPERRNAALVFQDYALFDHLDVVDNVAFALRARGTRRRAARIAARDALGAAGLGEFAARHPRDLSGGQRQRVAIARALIGRPRLLLLDEPTAALDAGAKVEVRRALRRALDDFAGITVLVTHDPLDVHVLADRTLVLDRGAVVQEGPLAEITARPRSSFVARLAGVNLVDGVIEGDRLVTDTGAAVVVADHVGHGPGFAAFAPSAVALHAQAPSGSSRNAWPVTVTDVEAGPDRVRVGLTGAVAMTAEITPASMRALAVMPGAPLWASVKATEIAVYLR